MSVNMMAANARRSVFSSATASPEKLVPTRAHRVVWKLLGDLTSDDARINFTLARPEHVATDSAGAVIADPSSETIPTGYLVLNVGTGDVKRHAGGYVWEIQIGNSASSRIGFYGVTPVVQPSGADQAAVTLGNVAGEIAGLTISDPRPRPRFRRCGMLAKN
jgi:hypothetical protein